MWTLMLVFSLTGWNYPSSQQVFGYSSKTTCNSAGMDARAQMQGQGVTVRYACVVKN